MYQYTPSLLERDLHVHEVRHRAGQRGVEVRVVPAPRPPSVHAHVVVLEHPVQTLRRVCGVVLWRQAIGERRSGVRRRDVEWTWGTSKARRCQSPTSMLRRYSRLQLYSPSSRIELLSISAAAPNSSAPSTGGWRSPNAFDISGQDSAHARKTTVSSRPAGSAGGEWPAWAS